MREEEMRVREHAAKVEGTKAEVREGRREEGGGRETAALLVCLALGDLVLWVLAVGEGT